MPRISIITVCRNALSTLPDTAASILQQSSDDWEWIIMDGASTDGTVDWAAGQHWPDRVRFFSEPDAGIYDAMNKTLALTTGQFVHFLGADDALHDDHVLKDVGAFLEGHPDCNFLYGSQKVVYSDTDVRENIPPAPETLLEFMVTECLPHSAGSFFRRDLFMGSMGQFSTQYRTASDYQWMLRALARDYIRPQRIDRVVGRFSGTGASSHLQASISECQEVLRGETAFLAKVGGGQVLKALQAKVLKLTLEVSRLQEESSRRAAKIGSLKIKEDELRKKIDRLRSGPASPSGSSGKSWIRRFLGR